MSTQERGRGFASMDPAKHRRIASKGGKTAHANGHAHKWTSDEAREAGRKGGLASHGGRRPPPTPPTTKTGAPSSQAQ